MRRPRLGKPSLFEQRNRGGVVIDVWWQESDGGEQESDGGEQESDGGEQGSDGERSMGVMEKEMSMGVKPT